MNREFILKYWYADVYEQFENQTGDVDFLLGIIARQTGGTPQNILEVACGGGRISIPLARAGHRVTGFDADEFMLLRCYRRMKDLPNMSCYQADAIKSDWGCGYDIVVIAGNFLINIQSDMEYAEAQALIIKKAAGALKPSGHCYLDFDLHHDPAAFFSRLGENSYFCGTDDMGTSGKTVGYGSVYDPVTQICSGANHIELCASNGEKIIYPSRWYKHIPTQDQVYGWLCDAGLEIERTWQNYTDDPPPHPVGPSTHRATVWARKK